MREFSKDKLSKDFKTKENKEPVKVEKPEKVEEPEKEKKD